MKNKNNFSAVENLLFKMLTKNTGKAMGDSGDLYGRNWEVNKKKTIQDFFNEPSITFDTPKTKCDLTKEMIDYEISLFHALRNQLNLDGICEEFNRRNWNAKEFDGDRLEMGVCKRAENWLYKTADFYVKEMFILSYNWSSRLSQTIQFGYLEIYGETYVLLQIHGGCDVRGGYTPAMLFKLGRFEEYLTTDDVYGTITRKNGTTVDFQNEGANSRFSTASGGALKFNPKTDKLELMFSKGG